MKLTIKTLQQSTFKVDIESDKTVKDLKEVIEREQGKDYPCEAQKLIYSGKILTNENKLAEYNFDEKKFIVLMITRPPVSKQQTSTTSSSSATDSTASNTVKSESAEDTKPRRTTRSSVAAATNTSSETSSNPVPTTTGTSVAPATNMTPANTSNTATIQTPAATEQRRQAESRSSALSNEASILAVGEPQVASRLASMMAQPHFRQMQDLIQQSPHLLSSMIESLAASDPEMYNFISENPDVFVNALNHPPIARTQTTGGSHHQSDMMSQQQVMAAMAAAAGLNAGGQQPRVVDQLHGVSEHDKEAIERLKELGFSEYLAVQAYMACDKDEQLAADLLFQMD